MINALVRAGFVAGRRSGGSHQAFERRMEGEPTRTAIVVLGKREIPRGTIRSIIRQAGLTVEEFCGYLR